MVNKFAALVITLLSCLVSYSQELKPGFDKEEYISLMKVSAQFGDSSYSSKIAPPPGYKMIYRSPEMGFDNRWDLWQTDKGIPVISIRGTTKNEVSWLANFYAAMVSANGELQLSEKEKFSYKLADNPRAAVHVGWLVATGFLSKNMMPKIDSCYKKGVRNFYITGHSQGGAIAYLLTAYLRHLQLQKTLPEDIQFKTYCSAAPKPGNLYFAYEYEAMTQGGWGFNVVNAEDWVPQGPFSIQTIDDFAEVNPFRNAKTFIKRTSLVKRLALNYAYNKLTKPTKKAVKNSQKILGNYVQKAVKKNLPGFEPPTYAATNDYARTGNTIVLLPKADYYQKYPQDKEKFFINHLHPPYLYLAEQLGMSNADSNILEGSWELESLAGANVGELYREKKPLIRFDAAGKVSGNTGCNNFNGTVHINGSQLVFAKNLATTRMMCPGAGEQSFLQALDKIDAYSIQNGKLILSGGGVMIMQFVRK